MVDPVSGSGQVQNLQTSQLRAQNERAEQRRQEARAEAEQSGDTVEISAEARQLQENEAEQTAGNVSQTLSNSEESLGLDPGFDEAV